VAILTTSGTFTYTQSATFIISGALRLCGAIQQNEAPPSDDAIDALNTLNALAKGWQVSGIHVWLEQECILFCQASQPTYQIGSTSPDHACLWEDFIQAQLGVTAATGAGTLTLVSAQGIQASDNIGVMLDSGFTFWTTVNGAPAGNVVTLAATLPSQATAGAIVLDYDIPLVRVLRVPQGRRYLLSTTPSTAGGDIETPLITLARLDYDYLPDKLATGIVTQFFYDPQTGNHAYDQSNPLARMSLWPNPQDNTNAIRFTGQRPIQDFSSLACLPDMPQEWLLALRWGLAKELALEYDVPADRYAVIEKNADTWFARCQMWDREPEPVLLGWASEPGYRQS
jgi:hypothetical protein